jgi:hypothetical protein
MIPLRSRLAFVPRRRHLVLAELLKTVADAVGMGVVTGVGRLTESWSELRRLPTGCAPTESAGAPCGPGVATQGAEAS